jgi:hypothetical protein
MANDENINLEEIPPFEEWRRFYAGEMTGPEEERMRRFAEAYPELEPVFTEKFVKPLPGELGYLTDEELEQHIERLRKRLRGEV